MVFILHTFKKEKMNTEKTTLAVCLGGRIFVPCQNFAECSNAVKNYISLNNFGSSDFYRRKDAGLILHPYKGRIAHVSYNGRVWEQKGKEITDLSKNDL